MAADLTKTERGVLDVEAQPWRHAGTKATAIREGGLTPVGHAQHLNRLLDDERALAYDALTVNRLRRMREERRARAR